MSAQKLASSLHSSCRLSLWQRSQQDGAGICQIGSTVAAKVTAVGLLADAGAELDGTLHTNGRPGQPQPPESLPQHHLVSTACNHHQRSIALLKAVGTSLLALPAIAHFWQNKKSPGTMCAQTCDVRYISYTQ